MIRIEIALPLVRDTRAGPGVRGCAVAVVAVRPSRRTAPPVAVWLVVGRPLRSQTTGARAVLYPRERESTGLNDEQESSPRVRG